MTRYRLSGAVMTHPKRRAAAERLAQAAPPGGLRVVMDPDPAGKPSVLRTALCAWSAIDDGATHQLVVQDDMILSDTFFARARMAVEEMPDAALALFALWDSRNGAAVRFGALTGARWVTAVNEYFPCVAIILPREVAAGFVTFGRRHLDSSPDDILMNRYLRAHRIPAYVSVPSLAEHEDHGSISGNAFRGPRRSVCFLPSDIPGREDIRLSGPRVLPFFKHGVAQCAVRAGAPGDDPGHWLHLTCEQYLEGCGLRPGRPQPAIVQMAEASGPAAATGTWLTAFTMGLVQQRDGLRTTAPDDGTAPAPDPAVLAEALATVGPGGISHAQPEERIAELRAELSQITLAGIEAGRETANRLRTRPARPRTEAPLRVGVLGPTTPLTEHLVRGLSDAGHQVTPLDRRTVPEEPTTPGRPAGRPYDALLDLTGLAPHPPVPATGAAAGTGATSAGRGTSPPSLSSLTLKYPTASGQFRDVTVRVGDLYGPGCPHDTRIGRLVRDALRSHPLTVEDPAAPLRPLHVSDLVAALSAMLTTAPPDGTTGLAGAPVTAAELAAAVQTAVRPVPINEAPPTPPATPPRRTEEAPWPPAPPGWKPATELTYGLHTHAQWLAYEDIHLALDI
ncbi:hypothetical protein [Streptomyces sp. CT34]|uniref:hypothetical protein n=1 Tax=Streptomyces sp. CT34 TaxID=1553907 RepID=UPI000A704620|nr:hypothetical protein [Streptomyces sp. CT34]